MDGSGESCYPSTKLLAEETGLSERSVCTHLEQAERDGWIKKRVLGINGQGWKRHSYSPSIPPNALKDVQQVKALKEVQYDEKGTEPHAEGTEPDDKKALKDVQCSTSVNSSLSTPSVSISRTRKKKPAPKEPIPIPEDWKPDPRVYSWAEKHGISSEAVDREIDEFILYWKGRGESRPGWDSTFLNRLRQVQRGPPPTNGRGQATKPPRARHDDKFGERTYTGTPVDEIDWLNAGDA